MESCVPSTQRSSERSEGMVRRASFAVHTQLLLVGAAFVWSVLLGASPLAAQSLVDLQQSRGGLRSSTLGSAAQSDPRIASLMQSSVIDEPNEPNDVQGAELQEVEGPSAIELLLSGRVLPDPCDVSMDLTQFGYDMFRQKVSTFAPVTNVSVGPDYVVGPGDRFTLTMWGRVDGQYQLQVDRSGKIVLPEVGALNVWGMKFGELEKYLQRELSRKYPDFKMALAMDRLRTVRVFVVGEAATPSSYTVSSLATVMNALFAAGGPSKTGSLRKIRLLRNGSDPIEIDLYDFLLGGDKSSDVRLQDGDSVFIPLIGPVVAVAGNVKRPAIYEMTEPMTLDRVLKLAGGATFAGWLQRVQVERVEDHRRRIVVDLNLAARGAAGAEGAASSTVIRDGDIVKVFGVASREEQMVELEGHVLRPGKYGWKPGMRLGDILTSYDVLLAQPNTDRGEIERLIPPDLHPLVIPFDLGAVLAGDEKANIELAQYDTIRVFRWDERDVQTVNVSGMVFDPNEYRLVPGMRVGDLIEMAGGLKKNAYQRTAELTRRYVDQEGMTTEKIDLDLKRAMDGDAASNILLREYDHLVVRPIPELDFSRTVKITGEVRFPSTYPVRRGETLSSVIERAGGYTERAYLKGAVFTRESARDVQRQRLDQMIKQVEEAALSGAEATLGAGADAETIQGQESALEAKQELLDKLRATEITGRVVVRLSPLDEFRRSRYDMELEDGDTLTVPETPGVVHVVGEVFNETSLLYEEGRTVSHYLRQVGGMTKEADKKQVSVIKADGSVISKQQSKGKLVFWDSDFNQWFFGGFMSLEMEPGDTIVVPRKLDKYIWLRTTKDITQIVFQIAVAAGVVFAI